MLRIGYQGVIVLSTIGEELYYSGEIDFSRITFSAFGIIRNTNVN
jgi:hypothetical protein